MHGKSQQHKDISSPNRLLLLMKVKPYDRRRQWHPAPVLLPGKSPGRRTLVGCSPWGHYELGTTEQLHFHFSLSCIGEGNGNPPQCSCLENPRDREAWWAAISGVAQSWTQLTRLSSSSSSKPYDYSSILEYYSAMTNNEIMLLYVSSLSFHPSMDFENAFKSWLLWIVLL